MTSTVYAYTPPGADFPAFVNLSRNEGIRYTLTVRSQGNAGRDIASIVLFPDAVEAMATAALADLHGKPAANAVTDEMVNRFLAWKLPADFNPDGGVSKRDGAEPVGTNLLTAVQARAMLEHVLGVMPAAAKAQSISIKRGDIEYEIYAPPPTVAAMQPLDSDSKPAVSTIGFLTTQPPHVALDLDSDKPLPQGQACDLSGDGTCEACQ